MAITAFRWRRRIRVTSSSAGSGSLIPSDLRIRFPQVERQDVVDTIEFFPLQARDGKLHEKGSLRIGQGLGSELHPSTQRSQLAAVSKGSVADEQDLLAPSLQLRHQALGGGHH